MDTSSPWEGEGAGEGAEGGWADFSTASQEEAHGGDGWADFGAMSDAAPAAAPVAGADVAGFEADFSSLADESGANSSGNTDSGTGESGTQGRFLFIICRKCFKICSLNLSSSQTNVSYRGFKSPPPLNLAEIT
jgi:hypothetical protein